MVVLHPETKTAIQMSKLGDETDEYVVPNTVRTEHKAHQLEVEGTAATTDQFHQYNFHSSNFYKDEFRRVQILAAFLEPTSLGASAGKSVQSSCALGEGS
jgi:hypothetical protein